MIIFHTGDIHLDSPFSGLDVATSEIRRRELRETFENMMTYASNINADLVVITGDVFDEGFATRETIAFLIKCFSTLKCKVVITPGNHDPFDDRSIWKKNLMPENVYVFSSNTLSKFDFDDLNCSVWGWAFTSKTLDFCPLKSSINFDNNRINLLAAHADISSPLSLYCPTSVKMIEAFGADYSMLGHIHSPESANNSLGNVGSYCGCPEGRDFGEKGIKGANVIEIKKENGIVNQSVSFIRFCKRVYSEVNVNCDRCSDSIEIFERIRDTIKDQFGEDHILRINLEGNVVPSLVIDTVALASKITGLYYVEIKDNTSPTADSELYLNDKGIRGEVYRALLEKMQSSNMEERENAKKAFKYAISAINGENIIEK